MTEAERLLTRTKQYLEQGLSDGAFNAAVNKIKGGQDPFVVIDEFLTPFRKAESYLDGVFELEPVVLTHEDAFTVQCGLDGGYPASVYGDAIRIMQEALES